MALRQAKATPPGRDPQGALLSIVCLGRRQLRGDLRALELPRREAVCVEMEQVATWRIRAPGELKLVLHLGTRDRQPAHRALSAAAGAAVRPVRTPAGELPVVDCCSGLLSEERFVGHVAIPLVETIGPSQMPRARRPGARRVNLPSFADVCSPAPGPSCVWPLLHCCVMSADDPPALVTEAEAAQIIEESRRLIMETRELRATARLLRESRATRDERSDDSRLTLRGAVVGRPV